MTASSWTAPASRPSPWTATPPWSARERPRTTRRGGDRAMTSPQAAAAPARDQYARPLLIALLSGCAVALALGLYAKLHHPAKYALDVGGFSSPLYAKAWLTTFAAALALVQLGTGYRITRRTDDPAWMATLHRWSGRIA